ncbi:RNA 2',3'-cyclic phosphodiesterase [Deinococcus lacus]|uniref:RNA 2',3'-cyclic phosphodiesterase n=1 Tax=Deinococcus lacus TaxID=392561 RepID=A0ABW1YCX5_9DEIO
MTAAGSARPARSPAVQRPASGKSRLFFGIRVPPAAAQELAEAQRGLRGNWRRVRADQMHITLAFLPGVPAGQLADLKRLGARLSEQCPPLHLSLKGTGYFPNEGSPRVWFVKVEGGGLTELAAELRAALDELGVPYENLPFKAHVTLARKKGPAPRLPPLLFDSQWEATQFSLTRSVLRKTGPIYEQVATFRLRGSAPDATPQPTPGAPSLHLLEGDLT